MGDEVADSNKTEEGSGAVLNDVEMSELKISMNGSGEKRPPSGESSSSSGDSDSKKDIGKEDEDKKKEESAKLPPVGIIKLVRDN